MALEDGGNMDAIRSILEELAYTIHKISCEVLLKLLNLNLTCRVHLIESVS